MFAKRYDDFAYKRLGPFKRKVIPGTDYKLLFADPNNPHDMNKKYEIALKFLRDNGCNNIRSVYDALSDFLTFTDQQLATQYLRHNMDWEQRNEVESLYLFRSGTVDEKLSEYLLWFANGVLRIKRVDHSEITSSKKEESSDLNDSSKEPYSKGYLLCEFRGPFQEPVSFKVDYKYNLI